MKNSQVVTLTIQELMIKAFALWWPRFAFISKIICKSFKTFRASSIRLFLPAMNRMLSLLKIRMLKP